MIPLHFPAKNITIRALKPEMVSNAWNCYGPNLLRNAVVIFFLCCKEHNNMPLFTSDKGKPCFGSTSLSFQWFNLISGCPHTNTGHAFQTTWKIEKRSSIPREFTHRNTPTAPDRRAIRGEEGVLNDVCAALSWTSWLLRVHRKLASE